MYDRSFTNKLKINMKLDVYLSEKKLSQNDLGGQLLPPVTQGLISQWLSGKTRITLDYALQIQQLSGGLVSPQDCSDLFAADLQPAS